MNHETLREKVVDLALDVLDPAEAREVEAHVAGCPGCAAELASLRATRSAMAGLPPLPAPERGEAVLLAAARQAAEQAEARRPGLLPRWFWGAALGAVSAAAAVLVTLQLSSAPPTNRFDEGRDALAGRGPAAQPAAESAVPPAAATSALARGPEAREERAAEAKEERFAGVAGAAAPAAQPPAGGPPGNAGGHGEIGVPGAAGAAAPREPTAARSASVPTPQASNGNASPTTPPESAPARARKAVADQDRGVEPLTALRAAPAPAERATLPAEAPPESPRAGAMAADAGAPEAKAGAPRPAAPPPAKQDPQPSGSAAPAAPPAGLGCPAERTRTLERDAAGRLVRRVRSGTLDGREYLAEERFGPDGRLLGATLLVDGRGVALRAGDLEPLPGLRLAPTAAAAAAAPPACGP